MTGMGFLRPLLSTCLLLLLAAAPATQPASSSSKLLDRAHHVLKTLRSSSYQHVSDIDESAGEFHCDCSGFVGWLLRKEMPEQYKAVPFPKITKRPRAVDYYEAFAAAPADRQPARPWLRIDKIADAKPGDILAWRKVTIPEKGTTGHVVVLDSLPTPVAPDLFKIVVIDSTSQPHEDDTRKSDETGVGRGTVYIKVDAEGRPISFGSHPPQATASNLPIAIGRPNP
jgi:hypothetical protein